ncbi:MAG: hypothetical protein AABY33_05645 [Pseudomonadota bacterium]
MVAVNCPNAGRNGTPSAPITIQAENERRAWLRGDGTIAILDIQSCSYWNIVGLRASNEDRDGGSDVFFGAFNSNHINFRRNLLSNSNRRARNQSMITYNGTQYGLIEENELYNYVRHGFLLANSPNIVVRRNYANSRDYPSLGAVDGIPASGNSGGDSLVAVYPGSNNLIENNISERNASGFSIQADGNDDERLTVNNRFYGNISLRDGATGALRIRTRGNTIQGMAQNTHMENQVVIDSIGYGGDFRANKNTTVTNTSIFNSDGYGFIAHAPERVGDGSSTMAIRNSLAVGNSLHGFGVVDYSAFSVTASNSFSNGTNYSPASLANGNRSVDPGLGSCKVFIPDGSPMKNAGADGGDIGANILCRYENGVLTQTQLWDWSTGQFPCGVRIAGVNDIAGDSCFDVHRRLNVNTNGCNLPATPSCRQPAPPNNLPPPSGGGGTGGGGTGGGGIGSCYQ